MNCYFIGFFLCFFCVQVCANNQPYKAQITIETDIYNYSQTLINGRSLLDINDFKGENVQRVVASETIQATFNFQFEFPIDCFPEL
mgnify:CR=1 FL=1